jgi:hypothetical protein
MYMIHLYPIGWMRPPVLRDWINKPKTKPPQLPMKYLVPFQKKIEMPPATTHESRYKPRRVSLGGWIALITPN